MRRGRCYRARDGRQHFVIATLVGGRLDGTKLKLRAKKSFLWIDTRAPHKCFVRPGKHRVLYRHERDKVYVSASNTHALCECGAYSERVDGHVQSCSLCGGPLIAH